MTARKKRVSFIAKVKRPQKVRVTFKAKGKRVRFGATVKKKKKVRVSFRARRG